MHSAPPVSRQADLAANKTFHLRETVSLQFRSEFFNVLNHTNFLYPTNVTTSAAFGQIRSTAPCRNQIQFGLKLIFTERSLSPQTRSGCAD